MARNGLTGLCTIWQPTALALTEDARLGLTLDQETLVEGGGQ